MPISPLRLAITLLALATALIHFSLLFMMGRFDVAFFLNGVGYLALTFAYLTNVPLGAARRPLLHFLFIGYTGVTILAWVALGEKNPAAPLGAIGYIDKIIEILLIVALVISLQRERQQ
ncbi:MAG: hypothetical protein RMM58_04880 [Chloroflexota bacterium]|nr:hypothetical protein [Dehalococcoidia bacterium]MDW8253197.1 hypothetical protein [Chloroflexota bacterium]